MTLCTSSCWDFSIEVEVYFGWSRADRTPRMDRSWSRELAHSHRYHRAAARSPSEAVLRTLERPGLDFGL